MSVLTYPPTNDEEILRHCTKKCGVITATEDQSYFALCCIFCTEKFLYFDAFIGHIQTDHADEAQKGIFGLFNNPYDETVAGSGLSNAVANANINAAAIKNNAEEEDLTDTDPSLLEPQMVMIKEEIMDEEQNCGNESLLPELSDVGDVSDVLFNVKQEPNISMEADDQNYMCDAAYGSYDDYAAEGLAGDDAEERCIKDEDEDANYDDLVEESLLGHQYSQETGLAMHIKDRKMIQFLIDSYRRNAFLWDHRHPQFRDRVKRQQFLEWILMEFKRRFNIALAKDAITRKWDNLRTVYKRECNRMSLEKTNVSTLWYFKELHFLNRLYGGNQKISEAVIKETVYRRRYSALWNDVSTSKLLSMVEQYPCFYDKYNIDYRSKEKRGEALQMMAIQLQSLVDVTTIQISKRISQLRFDYSKQKQERLNCEQTNKVFVPSYTYYDQMRFMDVDVAPFQCDCCTQILQTNRELDLHQLTHQSNYNCAICHLTFSDPEQLSRHKQSHGTSTSIAAGTSPSAALAIKEVKYYCDLCTASFREKSNYEEHMRRHNDELFLPSLAATEYVDSSAASDAGTDKTYACDICGKSFSNSTYLSSHRALHRSDRCFKCDYPQCGKGFTSRQSMMEHVRQHYNDDEYKCEVCLKIFKSSKNLQNHRQIHDSVKRYICKICGSAFAQAAGLYLHKRRHNRGGAFSRLGYS